MKVLVVLVLCLVAVNCMSLDLPKFKRSNKPAGGRKAAKDDANSVSSADQDGSMDMDKGSGEDIFEKPITVNEFNKTMFRLVDHVYEVDQKVGDFGALALGMLTADNEPEDFEKLGAAWEQMTGFAENAFDRLAFKLAETAFRLYYHSEGFEEVDYCDNYKNFDATFDGDVEAYIKSMITTFLMDLECFRAMFQQVEGISTYLADQKEGQLREDEASALVFEFMKGLHVVRVNAIRFQQAVEEAAASMDVDDDDLKAKKEVKKLLQLRDLIKKSGLFSH